MATDTTVERYDVTESTNDIQSNGDSNDISSGVNAPSRTTETEYKPDDLLNLKPSDNIDIPNGTSVISDNTLEASASSVKKQSGKHSSSHGSSRSSRHSRTPEFDFETRFVVLNFLGLVPVGTPNLNTSGTSSSEGNAASLLYSQASVDSSKSTKSGRFLPLCVCNDRDIAA